MHAVLSPIVDLPADRHGDSNPNSCSLTRVDLLVNALHDMRDELVKTSLMLKDHQSCLNSVQRIAAAYVKDLAVEVKLPRASRRSPSGHQEHQFLFDA